MENRADIHPGVARLGALPAIGLHNDLQGLLISSDSLAGFVHLSIGIADVQVTIGGGFALWAACFLGNGQSGLEVPQGLFVLPQLEMGTGQAGEESEFALMPAALCLYARLPSAVEALLGGAVVALGIFALAPLVQLVRRLGGQQQGGGSTNKE